MLEALHCHVMNLKILFYYRFYLDDFALFESSIAGAHDLACTVCSETHRGHKHLTPDCARFRGIIVVFLIRVFLVFNLSASRGGEVSVFTAIYRSCTAPVITCSA